MTVSEAEFRALYDAQFAFVWRSLRRLGVRDADVLDLAQKVFLTAHIKLGEFEGRSRITTWLFGICQRVASDYRRSAAFRREVTTDVKELDHRITSQPAPSAEAESHERMREAESILLTLPEPQRLVFVLFELEELPGEDIAQLLEIPVGTVRSRLRLAREAFSREVRRRGLVHGSGRREAV